jgi:hypothetical protein
MSKANDLLGWAPRTELKCGLIKTIAYFDDLLKDQLMRASVAGGQELDRQCMSIAHCASWRFRSKSA